MKGISMLKGMAITAALGATATLLPIVMANSASAQATTIPVSLCNDTAVVQNFIATSSQAQLNTKADGSGTTLAQQNVKLDPNTCTQLFDLGAVVDQLTVAFVGQFGSADPQHACGAINPAFPTCDTKSQTGKFVLMQDGTKRYFTGDAAIIVPVLATGTNATIDWVSFPS
jgi:hypothetical protein